MFLRLGKNESGNFCILIRQAEPFQQIFKFQWLLSNGQTYSFADEVAWNLRQTNQVFERSAHDGSRQVFAPPLDVAAGQSQRFGSYHPDDSRCMQGPGGIKNHSLASHDLEKDDN